MKKNPIILHRIRACAVVDYKTSALFMSLLVLQSLKLIKLFNYFA